MNLAVGIDAQPRGLAITQLNLQDSSFIKVDWKELRLDVPIEEKIFGAYITALKYVKEYKPVLVTIELPMASQSSSSMALWGIYGAICAAVFPHCVLVEGIVPASWKKLSGLNAWAKETGNNTKNGIVDKKKIKDGVVALVDGVPSDLKPADLYDSIAIATAGLKRNLDRVSSYLTDSYE